MAELREATMADYLALNDLFAELDEYHRVQFPTILKKPEGPMREPDYIADLIEDDDVLLLLALIDNMAVGLAHVSIQHSKPIPIVVPRRYAYLESIVVSRDFRRKGIGRELLRYVEKWVKSKGVSKVQLGVWVFNEAAVVFYENSGYEVFNKRMWKELD